MADVSILWYIKVVATTLPFLLGSFSRGVLSAFSKKSKVSSSPSVEPRGVPTNISVVTERLIVCRVWSAAERRAGTIAGPGKICALTMCAHVAMASGPRVYCA